MEKKRILTGDRPTGRMHLGHYVGSLVNRVRLPGRPVAVFTAVSGVCSGTRCTRRVLMKDWE